MLTLKEVKELVNVPCSERTDEQNRKLKEFNEYYNEMVSSDSFGQSFDEGITEEDNLIKSAVKETSGDKHMSLKGKRVLIKWIDAVSGYNNQSGWVDLNDFESPLGEVETYGVVVFEDKNALCVAGSYAQENDFSPEQANGIMTIPKVCIQDVYFLKTEKQKNVFNKVE